MLESEALQGDSNIGFVHLNGDRKALPQEVKLEILTHEIIQA